MFGLFSSAAYPQEGPYSKSLGIKSPGNLGKQAAAGFASPLAAIAGAQRAAKPNNPLGGAKPSGTPDLSALEAFMTTPN
jgi:hypothetical protein